MTTPSLEIIYIGDPLCSWCWGMAEELERLRTRYGGQAKFSLILGGLRPGGKERIKDLSQMLAHHWKQVSQVSGQSISHEILKKEDFIYDTEPPSRAVRVVRELDSSKEFDFFKAVQEAFYVRNQDTNRLETYLQLCRKMDVDPVQFKSAYLSDEARKQTQTDFQQARHFGIRSFPTVLLRINEEYHMIARGYARMEDMDREIRESIMAV